ncbi:MAG: hypothetical protein ABSD20_06775 [Terriglobales bacterium]|jgi:hypothetical protein
MNPQDLVILSEAKDLLFSPANQRKSGSFASLKMTTQVGKKLAGTPHKFERSSAPF